MLIREPGKFLIRRRDRGTALVETALVLPLYLTVLLGLIYFGYASLSKQRQALSTAYAAWLPDDQQADQLLAAFWPFAGSAQGTVAGAGNSSAIAGDNTLDVQERSRQGDEYYGSRIPSQLTAGVHTLAGPGTDVFDRERIAVSLWNYALGEVTQYVDMSSGSPVTRQQINYNSIAGYLNANSNRGLSSGGGFVSAGEGTPPGIGQYEVGISSALSGVPGQPQWLQRRAVTSQSTYLPPFFRQVFADEGAPDPTFTTYMSGDYPVPVYRPTTNFEFDLTGRGAGLRRCVGESGQTTVGIKNEVGSLLGSAFQDDPDAMDASLSPYWSRK